MHREVRMIAAWVALLAAVVMVSGCSSIAVGLGLRTRLDKLPVTGLSATLSPVPALAPGKSAPLIIVATTDDGKQFVTVGAGKGKVVFDSFTFDATIAQVNKKGVVSMPSDPRVSEGLLPHIRITAVGHPDVVTDLDIPLRYDVNYVAHFDGAAGFDGIRGTDGLQGSSGSDAFADANGNLGPGGNGGDGGNGGNGSDGDSGGPGQAVHVWMTLTSGAGQLLQVRVAGSKSERFYLIDPAGGSLEIDANGGRGGAGGAGGRGGQGGSGGSGFPSGFPGQAGRDGWSGHDGLPGAAGTLVVSLDPAAQAFAGRLHFVNHSGGGTPGPSPQISVEPVSAIW